MRKPSLTILLVETDLNTRELYQRELEEEFQVLACASESEALALIQKHPVGAIILEPNSPGEEGWAFLARLKTMRQTWFTPIILCTTSEERRRGLKLGAALFLIKPVLPERLTEALHRVLAS